MHAVVPRLRKPIHSGKLKANVQIPAPPGKMWLGFLRGHANHIQRLLERIEWPHGCSRFGTVVPGSEQTLIGSNMTNPHSTNGTSSYEQRDLLRVTLSCIGDVATSRLCLARLNARPSRKASRFGDSTASRVSSPTRRMRLPSGRPVASSRDHPVNDSATGLRKVTRSLASVVMTKMEPNAPSAIVLH